MSHTNLAIIIGNIGQVWEKNGCIVFSVCTSERFKRNEEWTDDKQWHNCVMFGNEAKNWVGRLQKGDVVAVTGTIRLNEYTTESGETRSDKQIHIKTIEAGSRKRWESQGKPRNDEWGNGNQAISNHDDIPF